MTDLRDVSPINALTGMAVLSLATGNKLGEIRDLYIDPINGVLLGVTIFMADGSIAELAADEIHSFGRDAVMARTELSAVPLDSDEMGSVPPASKLIGTKIITESGDVLGHITNIFVTLKPPPHILYEARNSILDKLLGREFFLPASVGHALSDDATRLVVPNETAEIAAPDLSSLVDKSLEVRSFDPDVQPSAGLDDTILIRPDEDETVVRLRDEDETVVRLGDDDDTVVRQPRSKG